MVSKKCATLVHIKTPNGKSINMPIGGIVVIISVFSGSSEDEVDLTNTIETNTQIDASRRSQPFYLVIHHVYVIKGWHILKKKDKQKYAVEN